MIEVDETLNIWLNKTNYRYTINAKASFMEVQIQILYHLTPSTHTKYKLQTNYITTIIVRQIIILLVM